MSGPYREGGPSSPVPLKWRVADAWDWLVKRRAFFAGVVLACVVSWSMRQGVLAVGGCHERNEACQAECMASAGMGRYERVAGRCFCTSDWETWTEVTP